MRSVFPLLLIRSHVLLTAATPPAPTLYIVCSRFVLRNRMHAHVCLALCCRLFRHFREAVCLALWLPSPEVEVVFKSIAPRRLDPLPTNFGGMGCALAQSKVSRCEEWGIPFPPYEIDFPKSLPSECLFEPPPFGSGGGGGPQRARFLMASFLMPYTKGVAAFGPAFAFFEMVLWSASANQAHGPVWLHLKNRANDIGAGGFFGSFIGSMVYGLTGIG